MWSLTNNWVLVRPITSRTVKNLSEATIPSLRTCYLSTLAARLTHSRKIVSLQRFLYYLLHSPGCNDLLRLNWSRIQSACQIFCILDLTSPLTHERQPYVDDPTSSWQSLLFGRGDRSPLKPLSHLGYNSGWPFTRSLSTLSLSILSLLCGYHRICISHPWKSLSWFIICK